MAENEKEIKEAIETLEEISSDEAKERMAELRQKYIMDRAEELETAEEKEIKKGIEKGVKRRTIEIARKMKEKNMPIDSIIAITELTREEIENI